MNIPSRVNPFGYDNTVPPGYFRVEFLESTGTQAILTDVVAQLDDEFTFVTTPLAIGGWAFGSDSNQYEAQERFLTGFAFTETPTIQYYNLWCSLGFAGQGYRIPNTQVFDCKLASSGAWVNGTKYVGQLPHTAEAPKPNTYLALFAEYNADTQTLNQFSKYRFFSFRVSKKLNFIPALSPAGAPCMHDTVSGQNFYNVGSGAFIAGFATVEQARKLATLPDVTAETDETKKSLTVSLPLALAFDDSVQSALDIAAARGWKIIVQYRESELTTKNIEVDFLESTGAQWIDTGIVPNAAVEFDMQMAYVYPLNEERGYNMFFGCVVSDSNGQFRLGHSTFYRSSAGVTESCVLESPVWFRYDAEIEPRRIYRLQTKIEPQSATVPLLFYDGKQQSYINSSVTTYEYNGVISAHIGLFGRIGGGEVASMGAPLIVKKATLAKEGSVVFDALACLDASGVPCMYDTVSGQNFYNANTEEGATPFTVGFDTIEKAAISISKLPATSGGTLTISLPAEAEVNKLVNDAIEIATNRGWTIITQYRTN